jgi:hypothetical protein
MASAAKLAMFPSAEALTVAEEYALLSGEEILAASQETSRVYNGLVLAKVVLLVQIRLKCKSLSELAKRAGIPKSVIYRHARGAPSSTIISQRMLRDLACFLEEQGVSLKRAI